MLGMLAGLLLLAAGGAARGQPPAWSETNLSFRAVCTLPETVRDAFLVRLPVPDEVTAINAVTAIDGAGRELVVRMVADGANARVVTVATPDGEPFGRPRSAIVYYGYDPAVSAAAGENAPVTAHSVLGVLRPVAGQGPPPTWERYHYMFFQPGGPRHTTHVPAVEPFDFRAVFEQGMDEDARTAFRERNRDLHRTHQFIALESWIRLPAEGHLRFALRSSGFGIVFVDGVEAASTGAAAQPADWEIGDPVELAGPVAHVEVYVTGHRRSEAMLGWIPPGRTEPEALPASAWLAPVEVTPRLERIDHPLHADFAILPGSLRPFAFRGYDQVFVPLVLENRTHNWTGHPVEARWRDLAGRELGTGDRIDVVMKGGDLHGVDLEVRDRLGFVGTARRTFDARRIEPRWFAVDVKLLDVPSVSYAEDVVMPALHVSGETPSGYPAKVAWRIETPAGEVADHRELALSGTQEEVVPAGRFKAGEIDRITWEVEVAGTVLQSGVVRFLRPPFDTLPARAEGDALLAPDGTRLALVPHRYAGAFSQPPITEAQAFGHVLCVDETLTRYSRWANPGAQTPFGRVLARIVDGPDHPVVTVVPLEDAVPSHEAYAPLKHLVVVPRLVKEREADVVVLSLGLNAILWNGDTERFERLVAALSDLVSDTLGRPVVWVTPPPYGPQPGAVRPYAAALQRVADARGMPVADLYSALLAMRAGVPVFVESFDLDLTPEAEIIAARIVARAMLAADAYRPINLRSRMPW